MTPLFIIVYNCDIVHKFLVLFCYFVKEIKGEGEAIPTFLSEKLSELLRSHSGLRRVDKYWHFLGMI